MVLSPKPPAGGNKMPPSHLTAPELVQVTRVHVRPANQAAWLLPGQLVCDRIPGDASLNSTRGNNAVGVSSGAGAMLNFCRAR